MILYEAYNKTNGKVYVGLTTKSLKHRVYVLTKLLKSLTYQKLLGIDIECLVFIQGVNK